ncbi:unnamed protein product, partial [marine sediment metagenome]
SFGSRPFRSLELSDYAKQNYEKGKKIKTSLDAVDRGVYPINVFDDANAFKERLIIFFATLSGSEDNGDNRFSGISNIAPFDQYSEI